MKDPDETKLTTELTDISKNIDSILKKIEGAGHLLKDVPVEDNDK